MTAISLPSTREQKRHEFFRGVVCTLPLILGAIPFGILYGAMAIDAGLSPMAAQGMSLLVFAGSGQFVAAGLFGQGTVVAAIVFTVWIVNVRHALYAASLAPHTRHLPHRWLLPLGFWLTDETYAVTVQRYQRGEPLQHAHWFFFGSALSMYLNWQLCTLIGIVAGTRIEGLDQWGLEMAMVVTFIGIVVPQLVSLPLFACAVVAGVLSLVFAPLPHGLGLVVASVCAILMGFGCQRILRKKPPEPPPAEVVK